MSSFKIRPRFRQKFTSGREELIKLFKDRIEQDGGKGKCRAVFSGNHIILSIPTEKQHYWSPQLNLSLEEEEEEIGTLIRGLYGPAPSVWTLFAFSYFALAVAFVITGIVGYSFYILEKPTWLFWLLPAYVVLALVLYLIAQFGQKLGAEQTFMLHHFYEETVGKSAEIE